MKRGFPNTQLVFRIALGLVFIHQTLSVLVMPQLQASAATVPYPPISAMFGFKVIVVNMLLFVIGIWLLFGIRTRVVALLGAALCVVQAHVEATGQLFPTDVFSYQSLVIALAIPLVFFGGGALSMYRKGWDNLA